MSIATLKSASLPEVRKLIREGTWTMPTPGLAPGYVQANVLIVPKTQAYDFMLFCIRNPKPCALIEVLEPGITSPAYSCQKSDIRYDIPKYRVYRNGAMETETPDIADYWREDFVTFIMGCSFTFENALMKAGITVRHIEEQKRVPLYRSNIKCKRVSGIDVDMMVSMRPIPLEQLAKTVQITARFPSMHGAPIHIGDPSAIGIKDIDSPYLGDPVEIRKNEIPVFWACGGTVYNFVEKIKCNIAITHAPSHMYLLDIKDESFFEY